MKTAEKPSLQLLDVEKVSRSAMNKEIFEYVKLFIDDEHALITALVQNPCGKTDEVQDIEHKFGPKVARNITFLNQLHELKDYVFHKARGIKVKEMINIFLANVKFLFAHRQQDPQLAASLSTDKVRYAMKLLEKSDIFNEIQADLQDTLFHFLEPTIYERYTSLLKLSHEQHKKHETEVRRRVYAMLHQAGIKAEIQARVKSIYSIHHKIMKYDLLLSQVLDHMGLRVIVNEIADCYRAMEVIVRHWPILQNRVKDYIAVPKENGYQSIHMTVLYKNYPVEIQIRTVAMHCSAQYGKAAHKRYKQMMVV